jgi:DUF917 family protein
MRIDWKTAGFFVYGGTILEGGGGGSLDSGLEAVHLALSLDSSEIVSLSELFPGILILTVSTVGAPAAEKKYVKPMDFVQSVQMIINGLDRSLAGLIQNKISGFASANGLIQFAVLGLL